MRPLTFGSTKVLYLHKDENNGIPIQKETGQISASPILLDWTETRYSHLNGSHFFYLRLPSRGSARSHSTIFFSFVLLLNCRTLFMQSYTNTLKILCTYITLVKFLCKIIKALSSIAAGLRRVQKIFNTNSTRLLQVLHYSLHITGYKCNCQKSAKVKHNGLTSGM